MVPERIESLLSIKKGYLVIIFLIAIDLVAKFIAEDNGGKVLGSVTKKLDYLVVGDSKPTKKKVDQAKNLKITIISEKEWENILNN